MIFLFFIFLKKIFSNLKKYLFILNKYNEKFVSILYDRNVDYEVIGIIY